MAMIRRKNASVETMDILSNDDYDRLLSNNVVFLKLVDASAVNTVIECMVRHTPLVVNRIPAVEEYLGTDYPGFYDDLSHAASLLGSMDNIQRMHAHMAALDLTRLDLLRFLSSFEDALVKHTATSISTRERDHNIRQ